MLDGITVLSKTTIDVYGGWSFIPIHWILVGMAILLLVCNMYLIFKKNDFSFIPLSLLSLLFATIVFLITGLNTEVVDTYDQYKVLVNEEVSMKNFTERYEILDQDGLIYIIKEK